MKKLQALWSGMYAFRKPQTTRFSDVFRLEKLPTARGALSPGKERGFCWCPCCRGFFPSCISSSSCRHREDSCFISLKVLPPEFEIGQQWCVSDERWLRDQPLIFFKFYFQSVIFNLKNMQTLTSRQIGAKCNVYIETLWTISIAALRVLLAGSS